jgi:hypothetical protein
VRKLFPFLGAAVLAALLTLASPAAELVNTGLPDGKLGALSRVLGVPSKPKPLTISF